MKGLKLMGIGLLSFLAFGVANVNAETLEVKDEAELKTCVATDGNTCKLINKISTTDVIVLNNDVTIDLNGYSITNATAGLKVFDIAKGKVILTGKGVIESGPKSTSAIRIIGSTSENDANYVVVTIDKDVTVKSWGYGVFITHNSNHAYGVVVDIKGTVIGENYAAFYTNGSFQDKAKNYPIVTFDGAKLTGDGGIYAAGYAKLNINNSTISGTSYGIGIKSGILNLKNTKVTANGEDTTPTEGYSNGIEASGAAIQIESNKGYAGDIEMNIDGGTYISEKGIVLYEYVDSKTTNTAVKSINIKSGTFTAGEGKKVILTSKEFANKFTKFIETGTFSSDVASYVKDGFIMKKVSDTSYVVAKDYKTDVPSIDTTETPKDTTIGVSNSDKVSDVLLDTLSKNTELSSAIEGVSVTTSLDITQVTPATEDINKVKKALANKKLTNAKISDFFDITVNVKNARTDQVLGTLPELTSDIELVVALPEDLLTVAKGYKRTYYIVRNHNGELEVLDTILSADKKSISFTSSKFSTYAIAYVDTPITTANVENPQTGDNIILYVILGLISVCGIGYMRKIKQFNY